MKKSLLNLFAAVVATFCSVCAYAQAEGDQTFESTTQVFDGTLEVNLTSIGGEVQTIEDQSLTITFDTPTSCTVSVSDFYFGDIALGDIVVKNVEVSVDGANLTFNGPKQSLVLAGGFITADVACNGKLELATQSLVMNIDVEAMGMKIPVTFTGSPRTQKSDETVNYIGSISIPTEGDPIVIDDQTISITTTGADKCTLALYNFNFNGTPLGDIVIEDVAMTSDQGNIIYSGAKQGISLAYGMIVADVTCSGIEDSDGHLTMSIMVALVGTDTVIPVTFNGVRERNAIYSITEEPADAPKEYYRLNGMKADPNDLLPGLYIIRQGNKSHKTIIR